MTTMKTMCCAAVLAMAMLSVVAGDKPEDYEHIEKIQALDEQGEIRPPTANAMGGRQTAANSKALGVTVTLDILIGLQSGAM